MLSSHVRAKLRRIKCPLPSDLRAVLSKPFWPGLPQDLLERDPLDCLGYETLMESEENTRRNFVALIAKKSLNMRRREKSIGDIARQAVLAGLKDYLDLTIMVIRAKRLIAKWVECGAKISVAAPTGGKGKRGKFHVPPEFLQLEANQFIRINPAMPWPRVIEKVAGKFIDRAGKPLSVRTVANHIKDPRKQT